MVYNIDARLEDADWPKRTNDHFEALGDKKPVEGENDDDNESNIL